MPLFSVDRWFQSAAPKRELSQQSEPVTSAIAGQLAHIRTRTEDAVLHIGELLQRIVDTGKQANDEVKESLAEALGQTPDDGLCHDSLDQVVKKQITVVSEFMDSIREFIHQQLELAKSANQACQAIEVSAAEVADLTSTSKMLAINLRIEASRLGCDGNGFSALGQQVQSFSQQVAEATTRIKSSAEIFSDAIPQMLEQTREVESRIDGLTDHFEAEMSVVSERTNLVTNSLKQTLDHVEQTNGQILHCSNQTLSHLGFHDPVSQELQGIENDVRRLQQLIDGKDPEFHCTSDKNHLVDDPNNHAGDVEFF